MRFAIRRGAWSPLLRAFGASEERSYVEVEEGGGLSCRFGRHELTLGADEVASAEPATWPWWAGIGWRVGVDAFGLIGALDGIVCINLNEAKETRVLGIRHRFGRLYVSLEDPEGFIAALQPRPGS